MSYRKLSELVRLVDLKNTDCKVTRVIGVSITKNFIPSVANLNGVDLSKYNLIKKNQFACKLMSVGRDLQLPIDLYKEDDLALISSAYYVFEVKDQNEILPDYLNMWFRCKETDRWVGYISGGDVRGGISWSMFSEMDVNVPSIEKQRELVAQYQVVANKIQVNEQICEKLEVTAQALYKQWFVDFEFPNEEGLPYKSSGGVMVYNQELEKEIPKGWEMKSFTDTIKLTGGGTPSTDVAVYWNGNIPFFTPSDIQKSYYSIETIKNITELGLKESSTKLYPKDTIFITARGTVGAIGLSSRDMAMNQSCYAIKNSLPYYTHQKTLDVIEKLKGEAVGAVFNALVTKDFEHQIILDPNLLIKKKFNSTIEHIYDLLLIKSHKNKKFTQLQLLFLNRLTTMEK